jgi:hypothetical protein
MIEIGKSLPNLTGPTVTTGAAEILAFKGISFLPRADHAGPRLARIPQKWAQVLRQEYAQNQKPRAFSCQKMLWDQPCSAPEYQGCAYRHFTEEKDVGTSN